MATKKKSSLETVCHNYQERLKDFSQNSTDLRLIDQETIM